MRLHFLLSAIACCLLFASCKKNGGDSLNQPTVADLTRMLNIQEEAVLKYEESWKATHDTLTAIFDAGQWLLQQPEVAQVFLRDNWHLGISYKSGLRSTISVAMTGARGQHLTRGAGGSYDKGSIRTYLLGGSGKHSLDDKIIRNKKVLILAPYEYQFYSERPPYDGKYPFLPLFEKSKYELEVTLALSSEATFQVFKTIGEYGLIILNTHGEAEGAFHLYSGVSELDIPARPDAGRWTEADVISYANRSGNEVLSLLLSDKLMWGTEAVVDLFNTLTPTTTRIAMLVTDRYIGGMTGQLKDAVVFGNHCYSGYTTTDVLGNGMPTGNLPEAWMKAGVAAYYGYAFDDGRSKAVENPFCLKMEDSLITNLVVNGDSTGIAHLAGDVMKQGYETERRRRKVTTRGDELEVTAMATYTSSLEKYADILYLKLFQSPRYKYGCGTVTDTRDSQTYQLVCIGNYRWFAENLRYNASGSVFAHNDPSTLKEFGRLYNYPIASAGQGSTEGSKTIQGICPNGWHIPNRLEWENLESALAAADPAELAIMLQSSSSLWINDPELVNAKRNVSGFGAMPAGNATKTSGSAPLVYSNVNTYFVLSTKNTGIVSPEGVYTVFIQQAKSGGQSASAHVTGGQWVNPSGTPSVGDSYYSCRCVENH